MPKLRFKVAQDKHIMWLSVTESDLFCFYWSQTWYYRTPSNRPHYQYKQWLGADVISSEKLQSRFNQHEWWKGSQQQVSAIVSSLTRRGLIKWTTASLDPLPLIRLYKDRYPVFNEPVRVRNAAYQFKVNGVMIDKFDPTLDTVDFERKSIFIGYPI